MRRIQGLAKEVRRDIHKMHAFVRFREVGREQKSHFVAWFEPEHHIVRAASGFFVRRFANMKWTIVTPDGAAVWDGHALRFEDSPPRDSLPRSDSRL